MKIYNLPFYGLVYRTFSRLIHKLGFHHAPLKIDSEGCHRWCHWCGFRESYKDLKPQSDNPQFLHYPPLDKIKFKAEGNEKARGE